MKSSCLAFPVGVTLAILIAADSGIAQQHGTAFALLRTPDAIFVAADSKLSWFDTSATVRSVCKIRSVGSTWYVMGGVYQYPAAGYSAPALVASALRSPGNILAKAREFESKAAPAVELLLKRIEKDRAQTAEWEEVASIPLTLFIFGFEDGGPSVSSREFVRATTADSFPTVMTHRRDYGPDTREVVWLASPSTLAGGFATEVPSWQSMEPSAMVKSFVEYAIRKRPKTTGGPIDVLRIDRTGHRWLRRKTECTE